MTSHNQNKNEIKFKNKNTQTNIDSEQKKFVERSKKQKTKMNAVKKLTGKGNKTVSDEELFSESRNGNKSYLKKYLDIDKNIWTRVNKKQQVRKK